MGNDNAARCERIGGWHTQLVWRYYGFALLFYVVLFLWTAPTWSHFLHTVQLQPAQFVLQILLVICAFCCIVGFLRRAVMYLTAIATTSYFSIYVLGSANGVFPAVEWPLLIALPLSVSLLLLTLPNDCTREVIDAAQRRTIGLLFLVVMFFVVFHKLNSSHMLADYSCGTFILDRIAQRWGTLGTWVATLTPPQLGVWLELAALLLIFINPRLMLLMLIPLMYVFGLMGALSIAMLVLAAGLVFLDASDGERLWSARRRLVPWAVAAVIVLAVLLWTQFDGHPRSAAMRMIFQSVLAVTFIAVSYLVYDDYRRGARWICWGAWRAQLFQVKLPRAARCVVWAVVGAMVLNCITPFLGVKYHYSYSMFSNLRADQWQWNHWLVPSWVRVRSTEKYYVNLESIDVRTHRKALDNTRMSGPAFVHWIQQQYSRYAQLALVVDVDGQRSRWNDAFHDADFEQRLVALATSESLVEIVSAEFRFAPQRVETEKYINRLEPAYFESSHLLRVLQRWHNAPASLVLRLSYDGEAIISEDAARDQAVLARLAQLPRSGLLQQKLSHTLPQQCMH